MITRMTGVFCSKCSPAKRCRTLYATTRTCSLASRPHISSSTLQSVGWGISTLALKSGDATDAALEDKITDLTKRRNEIAMKMITILENAAFHGQEINEEVAEPLVE